MSLKNILTGLGRRILGGKKESATPATGQQQRQITYEPKPSQAQGQELATREIRNPPVVLKKTKPLQMGDDIAPAFGSSTYDWAMRIGRSKYTADEWLNHLTSTRKVNFKIFGKPATKTVREPKRFKYDSGPFAGKEVNVSREELFDSNLAIFNDAGDLTGGLLYAAKKFGLKLDANEVGAVLKLNPINRLQAIELGVQKGAQEKFEVAFKNMTDSINTLKQRFSADTDLVSIFDDALYQMGGMKNGELGKGVFNTLRDTLRRAKARPDVREQDKALLNKAEAELNIAAAPLRTNKTKYQTERNYTLQGGKDYRETIFHLPEDIVTNTQLRDKGGHFSDILPNTNNIYHVRYDTRFTPEGKKVFMINEIQSDVNQSIAKALQKNQQLSREFRTNPFNADIELNFLMNRRAKLLDDLNEAIEVQDFGRVNAIKSTLDNEIKMLSKMTTPRSGQRKDYFPMVESDAYADHAIKYLSQKAAR